MIIIIQVILVPKPHEKDQAADPVAEDGSNIPTDGENSSVTSPAKANPVELQPYPSVHETIHEEDEESNGNARRESQMSPAHEEATQTEAAVSIINYPYYNNSLLPAPLISHLVLKFLIRNNFKQSANMFSQESGISFYEEQDKALRQAVKSLQFEDAISHVRATFFSLMASRRVQMKRSNYVNRLKAGNNHLRIFIHL